MNLFAAQSILFLFWISAISESNSVPTNTYNYDNSKQDIMNHQNNFSPDHRHHRRHHRHHRRHHHHHGGDYYKNEIKEDKEMKQQEKEKKLKELCKSKKHKKSKHKFHKNSQLKLVYKKLIPHGQLKPHSNVIFEYSDVEDDRKRTCRCICRTKKS